MKITEKHVERFWEYADKGNESECWMWKGKPGEDGYGRIMINLKSFKASRLSYLIHKGEIPDGISVCHSCDNPMCVNPNHLWLGTTLDNLRDMKSKGRAATGLNNGSYTHPEKRVKMKGEKNGMAVLTPEKVLQIRALRELGMTYYQIADIIGVSYQNIHMIVKRKTWKHL